MDSDLIDSNPAKIERPLKNEEKRGRFLTEEETPSAVQLRLRGRNLANSIEKKLVSVF